MEQNILELIDELNREDPERRDDAIQQLAMIGKPAVPCLLEQLTFRPLYKRVGAAIALGRIGDVRAVSALCHALIADSSPRVRLAAVEALAKMRQPDSILSLFLAIVDACSHSRDVSPSLTEPNIASVAIQTLAQMGEAAHRPLLDLLIDSRTPVRQFARESLPLFSDLAEPFLLELLNAPYPALQEIAAARLLKCPSLDIANLLSLLRSADTDKTQRLLDLLMQTTVPYPRALLLSEIEQISAYPAAHQRLVLRGLIRALLKHGSLSEDLLTETETASLIRGGVPILDALMNALDKHRWEEGTIQWRIAASVLRALHPPPHTIVLEAITQGSVAAVSLLPLFGPNLLPSLLDTLLQGDGPDRTLAANAIGALHSEEAVRYLIAALRNAPEAVVKAVTLALSKIGIVAVEGLCKELMRPDCPLPHKIMETLFWIGSTTDLPLKVLAAPNLTPQKRVRTLRAMHRVNYRVAQYGNAASFFRYFNGIEIDSYCAHVRQRPDVSPAASEGAREALEYLSLVRASDQDEGQELLRGVEAVPTHEAPDTLLRPADQQGRLLPPIVGR